MKLTTLIQAIVALMLSGSAVTLAILEGAPGPAIVAVAGVAVVAMSVTRSRRPTRWHAMAVWLASAVEAVTVLCSARESFSPEASWVALASLNAVALLLVSDRIIEAPARKPWKALASAWGFFTGIILLAHAYQENEWAYFDSGLLLILVLLTLAKKSVRSSVFGIQILNTGILLVVGLPLADVLLRVTQGSSDVQDPRLRAYSYDYARQNPGGFASWQAAYMQQLRTAENSLFTGPLGSNRRLRPNSQAVFFRSQIRINSQGFRGREISPEKGQSYRIVALGESTTFGLTMNAEDRPWPELLEELIRDRLKPSRPVEVINAGVPGYTLKDNLRRWATDILPLKPDLILSYHGINGFNLISKASPSMSAKNPPAYHARPSKLLANCEYRLRLIRFRRHQVEAVNSPGSGGLPDPMTTEYAVAYRQLIEVAKTNGIRLVLANYSMAVNEKSDPRVIEFYQGPFPAVALFIKVNLIHSEIVRRLAEQNPSIGFVDTNPSLDGVHEKFIDLIHFAPEGERQIAETLFDGVKRVLEQDLNRAADPR